MAQLLKGAPVAAAIGERLGSRIRSLKENNILPTLAVVRVGAREDDLAYLRGIAKRCGSFGVALVECALPDVADTDAVVAEITRLGADRSVHGILVMRPLPSGIDDAAVCAALPAGKDVDGITDGSMATVYSGRGEGYPPCTAQAVVEVLDHYGIELRGASGAVVGRSLVIGRPAALLLMRRNATVTICHTGTKDVPAVTRTADIVVAAAGRAEMLDGACFSPGQTVVDVGINFTQDGRMVGDVNASEAEAVCAALTPVPGGIGAVTTAVLLQHVVSAAERANQ